MILQVFSVFDSKVNAFTNPFYMHSIGECDRGFREVVNDPSTKFNKYPEDYTLFHLGSFDCDTGVFDNLTAPKSLLRATAALNSKA